MKRRELLSGIALLASAGSAQAFGFGNLGEGSFSRLGGAGGKPQGPFLLLVDGVSVLLLVNGTDKLLITGITPSGTPSEPFPIIF